jgi:hypothetical protein
MQKAKKHSQKTIFNENYSVAAVVITKDVATRPVVTTVSLRENYAMVILGCGCPSPEANHDAK